MISFATFLEISSLSSAISKTPLMQVRYFFLLSFFISPRENKKSFTICLLILETSKSPKY
ncbi:MAG: hypothetical protein A3J96_01270 [Sulfurimonas sp. RIFOXYC2_FULL_36_7]|nr:MAG: hypothetical protein A3J96_01270 [Sulfurimonas sp. RIFOXYC2_FULL_36_7]